MAHAFEPELSAAAPRTVEKRPGHRGLMAWPLPFVMPHTLIGIGMLFATLFFTLFVLFGSEQTARVVSVNRSTYKGSARWVVNYQYDGESGHVTYASDPRLEPTAPIKVRAFTLFGISHSEAADDYNPLFLLWVLFMCAFWNGIVFAFHYNFWIRPLLWRGLVRTGQPVRGQVTGKKEYGGRGRSWFVHYRYEAGLERREAKMQVRQEDYAAAEAGQPVTVLVNPDRPTRSVLYAYAPWRVIG